MQLPGPAVLVKAWAADAHAAWAAYCAAAFEGGGGGDLWLDGGTATATAMACDGSVAPVVTGGGEPGGVLPAGAAVV